MTYERQIATAQRLLAKFGGDCSYIQTRAGTPVDNSRPWRETTSTAQTFTGIKIAFIPLTGTSRPTSGENDRTLQGAMRAYVAAADLTITPKAGDIVIRAQEATRWRVLTVDTLNVNGEMIMHILQVGAS